MFTLRVYALQTVLAKRSFKFNVYASDNQSQILSGESIKVLLSSMRAWANDVNAKVAHFAIGENSCNIKFSSPEVVLNCELFGESEEDFSVSDRADLEYFLNQ